MGGDDKPIRNATIPHRASLVIIYHSALFLVGIYPSFPWKAPGPEQKKQSMVMR